MDHKYTLLITNQEPPSRNSTATARKRLRALRLLAALDPKRAIHSESKLTPNKRQNITINPKQNTKRKFKSEVLHT